MDLKDSLGPVSPVMSPSRICHYTALSSYFSHGRAGFLHIQLLSFSFPDIFLILEVLCSQSIYKLHPPDAQGVPTS
jgi:hypothetical protein